MQSSLELALDYLDFPRSASLPRKTFQKKIEARIQADRIIGKTVAGVASATNPAAKLACYMIVIQTKLTRRIQTAITQTIARSRGTVPLFWGRSVSQSPRYSASLSVTRVFFCNCARGPKRFDRRRAFCTSSISAKRFFGALLFLSNGKSPFAIASGNRQPRPMLRSKRRALPPTVQR